MMRILCGGLRLRAAAYAALAVAVLAAPAQARPGTMHLTGGGTATFSQIAVNVAIDPSGSASGSFECLMAGRSAGVLPPFGLAHNMIVHATPTAASVVGSVVTFTGPGRLTMDGTQKMDIHVSVRVDVAAQSFELTVVEVGPMGIEYMRSGKLTLR
jgi:hypothetical protein